MGDNKKGDMELCNPKVGKDKMTAYCNENFSEDVDKV